jgi:hypothetical protein
MLKKLKTLQMLKCSPVAVLDCPDYAAIVPYATKPVQLVLPVHSLVLSTACVVSCMYLV